MKILGNLIICLALLIVFLSSGIGGGSGFTFSGFLLSLVVAVPLLLLGTWLVGKHEGTLQTTIDEDARSLLDSVASQTDTFFLYLRPFVTTNAYKISDAHLNLFSWELWERDGYDDIERIVARALRPTAKFVALGKPGEHRGAARILTTEQEWREKVSNLAKSAKLIVAIPSYHEGTLWELELLKRENYLTKTIFIALPVDNIMYLSESQDVAEEWVRTKSACESIDIHLPDLPSDGALFKIAPEKNKLYVRAMPQPDPIAWMKTLQSLIDE